MNSVTVSRDPFARESTVRRSVRSDLGCSWCDHRRRSGNLFLYGTMPDAGKLAWHKGLFCSRPCHDAFHGQAR